MINCYEEYDDDSNIELKDWNDKEDDKVNK
jgi:hypothetical protein